MARVGVTNMESYIRGVTSREPCLRGSTACRQRGTRLEGAQGRRVLAALLPRRRRLFGLLKHHLLGLEWAALRKWPRGWCSLVLPRPMPSRPQRVVTRRRPGLPHGPALPRSRTEEPHQSCPVLVTAPRASADSNRTSMRFTRGRGLPAAAVMPSGH